MAPAKSARNRSVGTKLTEEEYARLEAAAAKRGVAVGEWCREELLQAAGEPAPVGNGHATIRDAISILAPIAKPADETLLAEVLALRTILLNSFATWPKGTR